jgi:hypothetical protein
LQDFTFLPRLRESAGGMAQVVKYLPTKTKRTQILSGKESDLLRQPQFLKQVF